MKGGKTFLSPLTIVENNFMGIATNQLIHNSLIEGEDENGTLSGDLGGKHGKVEMKDLLQ